MLKSHLLLLNEERYEIVVRLKDGWSIYKIAKHLGRAYNTIKDDVERRTVTLYNGKVFTTTDNAEDLDGYFLANILIEHSIVDLIGFDAMAAIRINNLFNTNYQNVAFRPMPNRNFQLQLNLKF